MTRTTSALLSGLDGLRAVAVLLVVVYHLFPALPSGFLGVDVFFVISGFLITTLLMREREQDGRIGLASFWRRRARRLLPAIAVMVLVCSSIAWLIGGDVPFASLPEVIPRLAVDPAGVLCQRVSYPGP